MGGSSNRARSLTLASSGTAPGDSGGAVRVCEATLTGYRGVEVAGVPTHRTTNGGVAGTTASRARGMTAEVGLDIGVRPASE
ncbi:hypothetical protein BRC89_04610 [Halobacteriales archaeon QS_4_70_19]|nr:MAG: hypothetical protein BRC89_04610 [Halobacteriales archaeon QS_4_70_19]